MIIIITIIVIDNHLHQGAHVVIYRAAAFSVFLLANHATLATDFDAYELTIIEHRFEPAEITVASGQKIKLLVNNRDNTAEEFESYELAREKIIPGGRQAVIYIGPLKPGKYPFFGEFHQDTARGVIIAE